MTVDSCNLTPYLKNDCNSSLRASHSLLYGVLSDRCHHEFQEVEVLRKRGPLRGGHAQVRAHRLGQHSRH